MAWQDWLPKFTNVIGIDFGTDRTRIWSESKGVVIDQPTAIAIDAANKVIAVGQDAADMRGRAIKDITIHQPIQRGVLYDAHVAKALLRVWLQEILGINYVLSPVVMVSVPAGATQAAQQAITDLLYDLCAREAYTIAQPLAAAIGAGVPIVDASGTLLYQLGAGVVEVTMISLGSVVASESSEQAGEYLDRQIQYELKQSLGIVVSLEKIRELKRKSSIESQPESRAQLVVGQDAVSRAPTEKSIPLEVVSRPVRAQAAQYLHHVQAMLSKVPPELTGDVLDKGMLLSGGLSQLPGLDQWLTEELGIPVSVVEDPDLTVIRGISTALEHRDEFKQSLGYR